MKNIDTIIAELKKSHFNSFHPSIPLRDQKILKNIAGLMTTDSYITENQASLLIKILKENLEYLDNSSLDISNSIKVPTWSKNFRVNQKVRKVKIEGPNQGKFYIVVEYTFDKEVKKSISVLNKAIGADTFFGLTQSQYYTLTEKNLITVYDTLSPLNFNFSLNFLENYNKIKTIDNQKVLEKFNFNEFYKDKESLINSFETLDSDLIKLDRQLRYQYRFHGDFDQHIKNSLAYKIAKRSLSKIFINSNHTSINDIFKTFNTLNRNKILIVLDDYKLEECVLNLEILKDFIIKNDYAKSTGVYFRFDNKGYGIKFNQIINEHKLNNNLNIDTKIAIINNGKLPKFMLKSQWYPDAVISFTSSLRSNKTDVYCNDCDLVVYYIPVKPLSIKFHEIL